MRRDLLAATSACARLQREGAVARRKGGNFITPEREATEHSLRAHTLFKAGFIFRPDFPDREAVEKALLTCVDVHLYSVHGRGSMVLRRS